MQKIHPLQERSYNLLRDLYLKENLGVTKAIYWSLEGYYPGLELILDTLGKYKDKESVSKFISDNENLINETKEELQTLKEKEEDATVNEEEGEDENFFGFELVNAFREIKSKPLGEIEDALSAALSELFDEKLIIDISSISKDSDIYDSSVKLTAIVKAAGKYR